VSDAPILITGGSGQVAQALSRLSANRGMSARLVGRPEFDFEAPETIATCCAALRPSIVINAAAYTAVDAAEKDEAAADRANHLGPVALAAFCAQANIPLVHISTDYVFDGLKHAPYVETDPTAPMGVYGATKLAGEHGVLASGARCIVLRTSWVYAGTGRNFVRTMLAAGQKNDRLRVVGDQTGCPTNAADLAEAILNIVARLRTDGWLPDHHGVFHAAGAGHTTWHGLAEAIFAESARHGGRQPIVEPITTADWPTPAHRPPDSRLDCSRLEAVFGQRLPPWRQSLAREIVAMLPV
jgi:dTDP-4-dehydrorhamnose reductase